MVEILNMEHGLLPPKFPLWCSRESCKPFSFGGGDNSVTWAVLQEQQVKVGVAVSELATRIQMINLTVHNTMGLLGIGSPGFSIWQYCIATGRPFFGGRRGES